MAVQGRCMGGVWVHGLCMDGCVLCLCLVRLTAKAVFTWATSAAQSRDTTLIGKCYIQVVSLDCFTLVTKACQIKNEFLLM